MTNYGHPLREEIVVKVAQKYETTKTRVWTFNKPPEKHLVIENEDDDGSDSDDEVVEDESVSSHDEMNTNESLSLSWSRPLSYRNQSIDLLCKSMHWFLCDNGLRHERVKW